MPDGSELRTVKVLSSIRDVPSDAWDACAGTGDPFVSHAFLAALEDSGSVSADTGWMPHHLAALGEDGSVAACAPLYLKSHSYGEYVFDWAWADAYERHGLTYSPKLLSAVPFSPVTGPRVLARDDTTRALLIDTALELARQTSSLELVYMGLS